MKNTVKIIALVLCVIFVLGLAACAPQPDSELEVTVTVLSGTTGMGMAKLISESKAEKAALNYNFSIVSDATQVSAGILGGNIDIAAVPTNLASTLYNKTNGGVQVLAISNLGVLYLLEKGNSVESLGDLQGKTISIPGQGTNPEFILRHVLQENGLTVGEDVFFDYTYSTPDTLSSALAGGLVDIALLPEPKVTAVKSQNAEIRTAIDLSVEWEKVSPKGSLAQGCIIVRKEFLDAHPVEVEAFLKEYRRSVEFVNEDIDAASELIAEAGIIPRAPLAKKAIPNCNIKYVDGDAMKAALTEFYSVLFELDPKSIGGKLPDDGLYYKK